MAHASQDVKWSPPGAKTEAPESSLDVRKMEETANQFNLDSEEQQLVMPIDVLFGSMIVINGAFVGIQATQDDGDALIYWIDLGFTMIFTVEFILRGILQADLSYVHQPEDTDTDFNFFEQANRRVNRFGQLRSRMRCWIFPPCPPRGVRAVMAATCYSLKEFSVFFDFMIISLSLLDSLVIVQLRNAGVLNLDTSALSVLRAFRLFRLAKLLRVFKLFPQLQKMVFALIETWRQAAVVSLWLSMISMYYKDSEGISQSWPQESPELDSCWPMKGFFTMKCFWPGYWFYNSAVRCVGRWFWFCWSCMLLPSMPWPLWATMRRRARPWRNISGTWGVPCWPAGRWPPLIIGATCWPRPKRIYCTWWCCCCLDIWTIRCFQTGLSWRGCLLLELVMCAMCVMCIMCVMYYVWL